MSNAPSRLLVAIIWMICGLLILATLSRQCAYEPLAPHEFVPAGQAR
jgi:hypothetical protein